MDVLTFVSKLLEALAWPVAAVVLVALLRKEIRSLAPFLKRIKAGPLEAEFEREVSALKANEVTNALPARSLAPATTEDQLLLELVRVNPRSAILEAWRRVETSAVQLMAAKGLKPPSPRAPTVITIIVALTQAQLVSPEEVSLFHELRSLRNQAAHFEDFNPTSEAASSYVDLAGRLRESFESRAKGG